MADSDASRRPNLAIEIAVPLLIVQVGVDLVKRHETIGAGHESPVDAIDRIVDGHRVLLNSRRLSASQWEAALGRSIEGRS